MSTKDGPGEPGNTGPEDEKHDLDAEAERLVRQFQEITRQANAKIDEVEEDPAVAAFIAERRRRQERRRQRRINLTKVVALCALGWVYAAQQSPDREPTVPTTTPPSGNQASALSTNASAEVMDPAERCPNDLDLLRTVAMRTLHATPPSLVEPLARFMDWDEIEKVNPSVFGIIQRVSHLEQPDLRRALAGIMISGLRDPKPINQVAALNGLAKTFPKDPGIDRLARYMAEHSPDEGARKTALTVLWDRPSEDNLAFMVRIISNPSRWPDKSVQYALIALQKEKHSAARSVAFELLRYRDPYVDCGAAMLLATLDEDIGTQRLREIARGDVAQTRSTSGARQKALLFLSKARDPAVNDIARTILRSPEATLLMMSRAMSALEQTGANVSREDVARLLEPSPDWAYRVDALSALARTGDEAAPIELLNMINTRQKGERGTGHTTTIIMLLQEATGGKYKHRIAEEIMLRWSNEPRDLREVQRFYEQRFGETKWPTPQQQSM